jgi:hypothetical protein
LNNSYPRKYYEAYNKNQNSFGSLRNKVECYKCNNFGHIAKNCKLTILPREPKKNIERHISKPQEICKRKHNQCSFSLQAQHRKSDWYVDNGFSKHMTGDKNKFLTLEKERDGYVALSNIECYKCHNYGHIARNCKSLIDPSMKENTNGGYDKFWRRKEN